MQQPVDLVDNHHAAHSPGRPQPHEQARSVQFSPKHSYSAKLQAGRAPSTKYLLPEPHIAGGQGGGGGSPGTIAAFRPHSPPRQLVRSQTMSLQGSGQSYSQLGESGSPAKGQLLKNPLTTGGRSPPQAASGQHGLGRSLQRSEPLAQSTCQSPEPPRSEISTVHRAINAAIASSVELMMCSPPEAVSQPRGAPAPLRQQQACPAAALSPLSKARGAGDFEVMAASRGAASTSVYGYGGSRAALQPRPARQSAETGQPIPPTAPPHPPRPAMTESYALEMQAALSPRFMTLRSKPMVCELDEPGSGIRFPSQRRSRLQKFLGRLMPCFVPQAEYGMDRAMSTPLAASLRPGQSPSLELPQLAIPMEPLRQSMAGLPGAGAARLSFQDADPAVWEPRPSSACQSPPHADLLGLFGEPSTDVIINIGSPELPSRPNTQPNRLCATPAEQLVATNMLSARNGTPEGEGAEPTQGEMHAKRNLMEVLRSRPDGLGVAGQHPAQLQHQPPIAELAADGALVTHAACAVAGTCAEQPVAKSGEGARADGSQGVAATAATAAPPPAGPPEAALPPSELLPQQTGGSLPPGEAQGEVLQEGSARESQQRQQQQGATEEHARPGAAAEQAIPAKVDLPMAPQQQAQHSLPRAPPKPASARSRKASPIKSPVKRTVISVSQLLARRKGPASPGSAKKRQLQQRLAKSSKLRQSPDKKALHAQWQLDAAKLAAARRREPMGAGGKRPAAQGARDLSKPAYRSAALHAMLSPAKTMQPLHRRSRSTSMPEPARQLSMAARIASAPVSPVARALSGPRQKGASVPASPTCHAQLTQPSIQPRMNKASTVRAAATQRKMQPKQQAVPRVASLTRAAASSRPGSAASVRHPAQMLASPEHTTQPFHGQRSGTPTNLIPAFAPGELGVDPYSARPGERMVAAGSAAAETDSPLSINKYEADRAEYLQMLQQLALGMEVNPWAIEQHKQLTPPPLPLGVLEEAAAQARQEREASLALAETVRPRGAAAPGDREQQEQQQGAVVAAGDYAGFFVKHNALSEEDNGISNLTTKTLPYSLGSASSSLSGLGEGLMPHSNELFGQDTASPILAEAAATAVARSHQRMVSFSAAAERALSGSVDQGRLQPKAILQGHSADPASSQVMGLQDASCVTDVSGGQGAVTYGASGQQTVTKPSTPRLLEV